MSLSKRFKSLWGKRTERAPLAELAEKRGSISVPGEPSALRAEFRPALPGFKTTASDHLDRGQSDPMSRQRIRFRNAFTPAQPVVDARMFAGRSKLLEGMIAAIEDKRSHVIIFGERGIGKTSLLRIFTMAAREARYIVVYFSCGATSDFSEMFRAVAAEIPLLYHSNVSPVSSHSEAGSTLSDLLPEGRLTPRQFSDVAAKLVGTRVLVVLDEFDRAKSPEFRRDIAELIKTLSDLSARVQLVIAGVATDLVDLMEHIPSIRRSIVALRVPAMSDEEVRALIENGVRASGVLFKPEAIDLIVSAAHGSPYLTNLVCHLAGLSTLGDRRQRVDASDVEKGLEEAIEEFNRRMPTEILPHLQHIAALLEPADTLAEVGRETNTPSAVNGKHLPEDALTETIRRHLEKTGVFKSMPVEHSELLLDSLKPYVQLVSARGAKSLSRLSGVRTGLSRNPRGDDRGE